MESTEDMIYYYIQSQVLYLPDISGQAYVFSGVTDSSGGR